MMLPRGPDTQAFENASNVELKPVRQHHTMVVKFETRFPPEVTKFAGQLATLQADHMNCWQDMAKHFGPTRR